MNKKINVNEELIKMSRNFLMENAPCIVEYPNNTDPDGMYMPENFDVGVVFVSKQGNCYGLGCAIPFCPIELLDRNLKFNKDQILQMFGGNIKKIKDKSDLHIFIDEYTNLLNNVPEANKSMAQHCINLLFKDIEETFNTNKTPLKKFKP